MVEETVQPEPTVGQKRPREEDNNGVGSSGQTDTSNVRYNDFLGMELLPCTFSVFSSVTVSDPVFLLHFASIYISILSSNGNSAQTDFPKTPDLLKHPKSSRTSAPEIHIRTVYYSESFNGSVLFWWSL